MTADQGTTDTQEQTEATSHDSTVNQPTVTDSTSLNHKMMEHHTEPSAPHNQNQDEEDNRKNQEGLNNANEINGSPKRLY